MKIAATSLLPSLAVATLPGVKPWFGLVIKANAGFIATTAKIGAVFWGQKNVFVSLDQAPELGVSHFWCRQY